MDGNEIIARFQLQIDDSADLSSSESLSLANEVYREIQNDRNWEWLKTVFIGSTSNTVPYIALPTDFKVFSASFSASRGFGRLGMPVGYYDNNNGASAALNNVVFVGSNRTPYIVIPFSQRNNYRNLGNAVYVDQSTKRLYFLVQPTAVESVEFDYIKRAPDLTTSTEPLFDAVYHDVISYGMASLYDPMQLTNKGESYQSINAELYNKKLSSLRYEDALSKTS